ncbi:MAG: glutamate formimidoyltransferase [Acidobacteriota bacterium]|jgi:glutamate formiminotransferase / formiminotetrahydrofolate cyclodeaminase
MAKIVECVPNFSEGRDEKIIRRITDAIAAVEGVSLRDVDPGADMNRVVVTFFGPPEAVLEGAFQGIRTASEVIDMSRHKGSHPRMGATDVCPFVPVQDVTMEECVQLARALGRRVGEELAIPVYLYENAAGTPERSNLADIRRGEYEGLEEKLKDPKWKPDFGPDRFNAKSGATVIGAREFLIAYNINLNSRSKDHATDIAFELREKGRSARRGNITPFYIRGKLLKHKEGEYFCGSCDFSAPAPQALFDHTLDAHGYDYRELARQHDQDPDRLEGESVKKPGIFPFCKAIGWEVPDYGRVQISINLTNFKETPPHLVLEKARELAAERGLLVTGSEIVGLVPLEALLAAGRYYLERQGQSLGAPLDDILETAVQSMGLRDVGGFDIRSRVIGYPAVPKDALIALRVDGFVHEVSRNSPAPGGGSVAALAGSLGAALAAMVANLTVGKSGYEENWDAMSSLADKAQRVKDALLEAVDADTQAFNGFMAALRMPKRTPEETAARKAAMQAGLKQAVAVPLHTARLSLDALDLARGAARGGNRNSVSDAGVAAQVAMAALEGAVLNVRINLPGVKDDAFVEEMQQACEALERDGRAILDETMSEVLRKIDGK